MDVDALVRKVRIWAGDRADRLTREPGCPIDQLLLMRRSPLLRCGDRNDPVGIAKQGVDPVGDELLDV